MSSVVSEEFSNVSNASINHPKISSKNQNSNPFTDAEETEQSESKPKKPIEKISTFIIWSIFNLLFLPFGIFCCYFSYKVHQYKIQNRYGKTIIWSKRAFVLNIITSLSMVGVIITIVMLRYDHNQRNMDSQTTGIYIPWQPGR